MPNNEGPGECMPIGAFAFDKFPVKFILTIVFPGL